MSHQVDFRKIWTTQIYGRKWPIGCKLPYGNRLINYYNKVKFRAFKVAKRTKKWQCWSKCTQIWHWKLVLFSPNLQHVNYSQPLLAITTVCSRLHV